MAIESDIATLLSADATLDAILLGGVYASGTVGPLGITRETTPGAFSGGWLLPAALVRQRGRVPDGAVRDGLAQDVSTAQVVEIYLYEDSGYSSIDAAAARIYALLEGVAVGSGTFPAELVNMLDRERDTGALAGHSLARMDFVIYSLMEA